MPEIVEFKPNKKHYNRVKDKLAIPTTCHCGGVVKVKHHSEIYGKPYGDWPWMYVCENGNCRASVGMHPQTDLPLGTLADAQTRGARRAAKQAFLEVHGHLDKSEAYALLANILGIPKRECHFGWFDKHQCRRVIQRMMEVKREME